MVFSRDSQLYNNVYGLANVSYEKCIREMDKRELHDALHSYGLFSIDMKPSLNDGNLVMGTFRLTLPSPP
jgi:hypothetical protein